MARSHAKILSSIWDPGSDFVALNYGPQWLYQLLLSQKKLTLVGLLTYTPSRWARLAADTTLASVEGYVDELEASRFVAVDRDTDELLIRTLVKNDVANRGLDNRNLIAGLWNAWNAIESRQLRHIAVENIPDSIWDSPRGQPPAEALQLRGLPPRTPTSTRLEPVVQTNGSDQQLEPLDRTSFRVSRFAFPGSEFSAPAEALGNSDDPGRAAAVDNSNVLEQALSHLTEREMHRNPTRGPSPERHREAVLAGKRRDHTAKAQHWLQLNPGLDAVALANLLEPTNRPGEPGRFTADGTPFVPGVGAAPGMPELGREPDEATHAALLARARHAAQHPNATEAP